MSFQQILEKHRSLAFSERDKGSRFELLFLFHDGYISLTSGKAVFRVADHNSLPPGRQAVGLQ